MQAINEKLTALQEAKALWDGNASTRRDAIMRLLEKVDSLTSNYCEVWNRENMVFAYLSAGDYYDDTIFNGSRQITTVKEPGIYRLDARLWQYCHEIAIVTHNGKPVSMKITASRLPGIMANIERAIEKELSILEKGAEAESVLFRMISAM